MAGIAGTIFAGGADKLLNGVASVINAIRGKDPAAAAELEKIVVQHEHEFRMASLQQENDALKADVQIAQMQNDVNKVEAGSANWWVSGWRPYIGWVCGSGLLFQFIVRPLVTFIAGCFGHTVAMPELDMGTLVTLLLGMLGLGGMRTYEKVKGASK